MEDEGLTVLNFEMDTDFHVGSAQPEPFYYEALTELRRMLHGNELYQEFEDWCTDDCIRRFLVARKYNVKQTHKMLISALEWRRRRKPHLLSAKDEKIKHEGRSGKVYLPGKDRWGRPLMILDHSVETSKVPDDILLFMSFNIEFAISEMTPGVEKFIIFVHMEHFNLLNSPPLQVAIEALQMMSTCYPERMGHLLIYKPPAIFKVFFDALRPFVEERTASKIMIIHGDCSPNSENDQKLCHLIGPEWRVQTGVGQSVIEPDCSPGYDFSTYWPALIEREEMIQEDRIQNAMIEEVQNQDHLEYAEALNDESSALMTVVDENHEGGHEYSPYYGCGYCCFYRG